MSLFSIFQQPQEPLPEQLRQKSLFGKSVRMYLSNPAAFHAEQVKDRTLFVVMGNLSNMGLIHGFGMHGGTFRHLDLVVMLPQLLFRVPLLRDILLWMGCISDCGGGSSADTQILHLLRKGKSVAYCPSGMTDFVNFSNPRSDDPEKVIIHVPDVSIFEFAHKQKIFIVPVLVKNESIRYRFLRNSWIHRVHRWTYEKIGWPFPFFFYPRIFDQKPLELLSIQIGTPMDGSIHDNPEAFAKLFMGQFAGLVEVGGDSRELLIQ